MNPARSLAAVALTFLVIPPVAASEIPKGWWTAPTKEYAIGVDPKASPGDKPAAFIESTVPEPKAFIALNQTFSAQDYAGKRISLSGNLRTRDVRKWAGFWVRADDANGKFLAFDNMQNRGASGTTDWKPAEVVLDIPKNAQTIYMGLILDGSGKVWMSNLKFEIVDVSTPVTAIQKPELPRAPANLDFTDK